MTYLIKNISNELVIEPHFGVQLEPGETKELAQEVAQRLLVIRPDAVRLVSEKDEPVEVVADDIEKETKEVEE